MGKCQHCGNDLTGQQKRFCSIRCNQNWRYHHNARNRARVKKNTKAYYEKMEDNPEYKRRNKIKAKKWIEENRQHYNDLVRPKSREYYRRTHKVKKENYQV